MFKHTIPFLVNWCFSLSAWQAVLGTHSRKRPWREDERSSRDLRLLETLKEEREKSNSKTVCQAQKNNMHCWHVLLFFSVPESRETEEQTHYPGPGEKYINQESTIHKTVWKQKGEWKDKTCQQEEPSSSSSWALPVKWASLGQSWRKNSCTGQIRWSRVNLHFYYPVKSTEAIIYFRNTLAEQQKHSFRQKG